MLRLVLRLRDKATKETANTKEMGGGGAEDVCKCTVERSREPEPEPATFAFPRLARCSTAVGECCLTCFPLFSSSSLFLVLVIVPLLFF